MPIIDRIIPQDAGTIEAGSTINKSQQILDEEETIAAKKKRLVEQSVGTKPSVALPEIPKADKPEKVMDDNGRIKHIDHGDKIRVPFSSMVGFGKAAAARREQFVGEALDKMAERVGTDRNLKIHGNRVFMETAIKHAVANGIPLECPEQKWQKEYERALAQTPKQKLAFGVAGQVAAGGAAPVAKQASHVEQKPAVLAPEKTVKIEEVKTPEMPTVKPATQGPDVLKVEKAPPLTNMGGLDLKQVPGQDRYVVVIPGEQPDVNRHSLTISREELLSAEKNHKITDPALAEGVARSIETGVRVIPELKKAAMTFAEQHGSQLHSQTLAGKAAAVDGIQTPQLAKLWEKKVKAFNEDQEYRQRDDDQNRLVEFPDGRKIHPETALFNEHAENVDIGKQKQVSGKLLSVIADNKVTNFHMTRAGKPLVITVPTEKVEGGVEKVRPLAHKSMDGKQVKLSLNKEGKVVIEDRSREKVKEQQTGKGQQV